MTPEQILAIAASQWTEIPTPAQIIKALEAGGFMITPVDFRTATLGTLPKSIDPNSSAGIPAQFLPTTTSIRDERVRLGLTQAELADAVGTSQQNLDRLEKGQLKHSRFTGSVLDALASQESIAKNKEQILSKLAQLRKQNGLTQEQLAERLDCHVVTVSKLETGAMNLTIDWVLRITRAIGVLPSDVLLTAEEVQHVG